MKKIKHKIIILTIYLKTKDTIKVTLDSKALLDKLYALLDNDNEFVKLGCICFAKNNFSHYIYEEK